VSLDEGVPLEQGHEIVVPPLKCAYFVAIGSYCVKQQQALETSFIRVSTLMTLNDLEHPK